MRVVGWIFATALSLFFIVGPVGIAEAQSYEPEELEFLELINDYRQQNGLEPLALSAPLSVAAERHSEDMGTYGFFSHTTQGSSYYPVGSEHYDRVAQEGYDYDTYTAENLAYGQATAAEVFEAWRVSPDHNVNMLGDYSVIGIGLVTVNGTPYWTTDFGAYDDSSAPGGSTDSGAANDAATPNAQPAPAEEEAAGDPAVAPTATEDATAPEAERQRETAATEQYAARDQYDAAETRAGDPSGQETAPEEPSPERAAADQYAGEAVARSAGEQITATDAAPTAPAETDNAPETAKAKVAATEPPETETAGAVKTDDASPDVAEVAASAGISMLPDTGGAQLPLLIGGAALLVGGLLARRIF